MVVELLTMVTDLKRIRALASDVMLLTTLGDVVTVQIDLLIDRSISDLFAEEFNDSEKNGLFIDNMILQRINENYIINYQEIFDKIIELTGDYDSIDGVTALIRVQFQSNPVEITIELDGKNRSPQLLQVTDQSVYFNLLNMIRTRWAIASRMLN
ncbi:MAG: hypothetical protein HeimC2_33680 [Candidatus Heimdallarchaeota archaeon LC_2]|nr:MAG: hypothetical protein HeimC2_33680 [Candidatus Heimdallarchaeota archaeon LC_2]